jgi:hypothetical protein
LKRRRLAALLVSVKIGIERVEAPGEYSTCISARICSK